MIDRHYGHLARDGREHAVKLLDALNAPEFEGEEGEPDVAQPLAAPEPGCLAQVAPGLPETGGKKFVAPPKP